MVLNGNIQIKDGIFMRRRKRRKHLLGKLVFLIGGAYALILAAAVIHSIGGPEGLIESVGENMDPGPGSGGSVFSVQ